MKATYLGWIAALVLALAVIAAMGWYAFSEGSAPLALIAAAPFVVLARVAVRRIRAVQR